MSYQQGNYRLFLHFVTAIILHAVILGGCAPQIQKPVRLCPGAESAIDSLSLLRLRSENTVPLKANGQCLLQYYDEDKKYKEENFPVKLWVNPPAEIYMQGDVAFDAKGVVLGSNEDEFWLSMKPKASTYVWGQWSDESLMYLQKETGVPKSRKYISLPVIVWSEGQSISMRAGLCLLQN